MQECPLGDLDSKHVRKPVKKSDFNMDSPMVQEVQGVYGIYLLQCKGMKKFDLNKMKRRWYKSCLLGIQHCKGNAEKVLELAGQSDFLNGRITGYKWAADFQWIFRPAMEGDIWNCDKILNGNYGNKTTFKKESAFQDGERTYGEWKK